MTRYAGVAQEVHGRAKGLVMTGAQCGWLKDKYSLSWQMVPKRLNELCADPDTAKSDHGFTAMLKMQKLDVAELERAAAG